jgi:hypothetical protein
MFARVRHLIVIGAVAVAVLLPAKQALAGPVGQTGTFSQTRVAGYFGGSGGEFTLYGGTLPSNTSYGASSKNIPDANNIALPPSFQTFCLETGENAAPSNFFVISSAAVQGGTTNSDRISKGTAWLYSQFAQGTLNVKVSASSSAYGDYFSTGGGRAPRKRPRCRRRSGGSRVRTTSPAGHSPRSWATRTLPQP